METTIIEKHYNPIVYDKYGLELSTLEVDKINTIFHETDCQSIVGFCYMYDLIPYTVFVKMFEGCDGIVFDKGFHIAINTANKLGLNVNYVSDDFVLIKKANVPLKFLSTVWR